MADIVEISVVEQVEEYSIEINEGSITVDSAVSETGANPVKSSGIWTWVKGLFTTHTTEANAHPATAIYNDSEVDGVNVKDALTWLKNNTGGGVGWVKIVDYTLLDNVVFISITNDLNNLPLFIGNNKKFVIIINHQFIDEATELVDTDGRALYRFNSIVTNVYRWGTNLFGYFQVSLTNRYNNFTVIEGVVSDYIYAATSSIGNTAAGANYNVSPQPLVLEQNVAGINRLDIVRSATGYLFKTGSNVKIYIL